MNTTDSPADADRYLTIARSCDATVTVKGSRFLAWVAPAGSVARAQGLIEEIRQKHHDATHHCFAYRIGYVKDRAERCSDAGEPSGTAGRPILDALVARDIWDIVAVVTRWFGGTKLGPGGLKRAYREAADAGLSEATLISRVVNSAFQVRFNHSLTGAVYRVIQEHRGLVTSTDFGSRVRMRVTVKRAIGPAFCQKMLDAGHGAIEIQPAGELVQ